jgi:uncharacterized metal-binding protein YceD (DUF177 family)
MNTLPSGLRLRIDGSSQGDDVLFEERLSPAFLDLRPDDELSAASDIVVSGRAYRASEWVMIEGQVTVSMRLPCAVCNEMCEFTINLTPWEQSIPASSVKDGMVDVSEALREAILIEVPFFMKCGGQTCHNAGEISQYLTSEAPTEDGEDRNQPFLSLL